MTPITIGLSSAVLMILIFHFLKAFDKPVIYGLALACIGFLYVGFSWSSLPALVLTSIQAIVFLLLAYFGIRKSIFMLALGYFFHGVWDLLYPYFGNSQLIPPHYDLFCMSFDFLVGAYLIFYIIYTNAKSKMQEVLLSIQ